VYDAQRVEVAITKKEQARNASPDESQGCKDWVRDVRYSEEANGGDDCVSLAEKDTQQAKQEEALQQKLLHKRPESVSPEGSDEESCAVRKVECLEPEGEYDGNSCDEKGGSDDPERSCGTRWPQESGYPGVK